MNKQIINKKNICIIKTNVTIRKKFHIDNKIYLFIYIFHVKVIFLFKLFVYFLFNIS